MGYQKPVIAETYDDGIGYQWNMDTETIVITGFVSDGPKPAIGRGARFTMRWTDVDTLTEVVKALRLRKVS